MNIKAILLDIDGTLTNSKKIITPKTKEALLKAQELGIKLVLASGRPDKGLEKISKELKMQNYGGLFVCYNGARVIDCKSKEVLVNEIIDQDIVTKVLNHLKKFDVKTVIIEDNYMIVENVYDCMIKDGNKEFNVIEYESRMNNYKLKEVDDLLTYVKFPINKILTVGDSDYLRANYKEMSLPFVGQLSMMFTSNFYYEYCAVNINKGKSLEKAMTKLGIGAHECIAFGDAENDISMLEFAGIGIAMANAQDKVKAIADEVTLDNNSDGIAHSLYKYIPELKD